MFSVFNTSDFYFDLLALVIIILPIYVLLPFLFFRRLLLIISGAFLLYMIAPRLALFYLLFWSIVSGLQRLVVLVENPIAKNVAFWSSLFIVLSPMVTWKLWNERVNIAFNLAGNELTKMLSLSLWEIDMARAIIIPIGISFATFRAIDLLVKTYLGKFQALSIDRTLFYGFFPAVQVVGPIIEYEEIENHAEKIIQPTADDILQGLLRLSYGAIKIFIIGSFLMESTAVVQLFSSMEPYKVWLGLFCYTWFFYLNFSGYSDFSIGISRLFGIKLKENFNNPYFSKNISDFWASWHISLSSFAQRNVFIPAGGYRIKKQYKAMLITMMVIALWHDLSFGMIIFGCYHGAALIAHRVMVNKGVLRQIKPGFIFNTAKILVTYLIVALGFPLMALSLDNAFSFYLTLLGLN